MYIMSGGKIKKWFDGFLLAGHGIMLSVRYLRFWVAFLITFLLFGTLMNLLSNGFASFELMDVVGFSGSLKIILDAMLGLFGVNKAFIDWFVIFVIAFLQGILLGEIFLVLRLKKKANAANIERAGIAAGLAMLGSGCPTCGTALLTPVLGAIFAGSSAIVGTISSIITILAIIIVILSLKKVGEEAYVIIISERYKLKKKVEEKSGKRN